MDTMDKEQVIVLSMIDKVRRCKVDANLYESKQKALQTEIEVLYTKLGKLVVTPEHDSQLAELMAEEIKAKEIELKTLPEEEDNQADLRETSRQLAQYITDAMKDKKRTNPIVAQVMPLMSSVAGEALVTLLGPEMAAYLLVSNVTRNTIIFAMTTGFLLYKLMSKHGMKINTIETSMTQQEIDNLIQSARQYEEQALKAISQGLGLELPGNDDGKAN